MNSQRIQHLREEFEYTQDFVAEYLECNRLTYANWETGNITIPLDIASKLAILYNVPFIKRLLSDIRDFFIYNCSR